MIDWFLNDEKITFDGDPAKPLVSVLRDELQMTGTKFNCGFGRCGTCTLLVDDQPVRACITRMESLAGRSVTTLEGLMAKSAVVTAWRELKVPRCMHCHLGQLMAAVKLLDHSPDPDDEQIEAAMNRDSCNCGESPLVRAAISRAAEILRQ